MTLLARLCNPRGDEIDADSTQTPTVRNAPLLNSILKPVPEDRTFTLFSSLPKELRLQIWEEATPRERVIHVSVLARCTLTNKVDEAPVRYLYKNHLGNPISGPHYTVIGNDAWLDHPLLTVNSEARQVVLDFYRIHVPAFCLCSCRPFPSPRSGLRPVMLRINPEHDVLKIMAEPPVKRSLIDFLWDLKAYDPKGVGLLKLALDVDTFCLNDLQYLKRSDLLLIRHRQALIETLSQLQEVWFVNMEPGKNVYKRSAEGPEGPEGIIPFGLQMAGFQSVGPDKREGVEAALQRVHMGILDPRELIWRWRRLLRTWEIHHPPGQVKYRMMLARPQFPEDPRRFSGRLNRIMDRLNLPDPYGISREHNRNAKDPTLFKRGVCEAGGSSLPEQAVSSTENTAAVGFWSFPIEAVGEVGEGQRLSDMDFEPNRFLDLRSYWPELVLAKMA